MDEIEKLYQKLFIKNGSSYKIDSKVRSMIYEKIINDIRKLMEKQQNIGINSPSYKLIDEEIRKRLIKEIQIIIDDYVLAKKNGELDRWCSMYGGDIEVYKEIFFHYRLSGEDKVISEYRVF